MSDAPAPDPAAAPAPTTRERLRAAPRPTKRSRAPYLVAGAALLAIVAAAVVYKLTSHRGHTTSIDWPVERSGGALVAVGHAVKAGDQFETRVKSDTHVVLGDGVDPMQGMNLYVHLVLSNGVAPADAGRLRSTVSVKLDIWGGTLPIFPSIITGNLGGEVPLSFFLDREADGRPVPGSGRVMEGGERRKIALEYVLSGLTDLSSNFLPPREVRLGDVWDLSECATIGGVVDTIRTIATLNPVSAGFPVGTWKGKVGADALEAAKDGEPCVRLKIALLVDIDGTVKEPAAPGWISAVAEVEGTAWVSTATGILWALETKSKVTSSYDVGRKREERRAIQTVTATTSRKS